ncbi:ankyrin repeat-containing protein 21 [Elsinoe australis]|uniref:Ankyrin repeat-containing protein 21 n=1 Tax=Elsinoe australis TaxID=40998 RepID=A0A4U7AZ00_9PEZI|nr:ankyrin repeat-containing protein 21 [Elsinoe australis]
MKDVLLVKRIIQANQGLLRNPDYEDRSNTSLHLAAELGLTDIVELLLDAGHEANEISRNTNWETPLMLAAEKSHIEVGELLVSRCGRSIPWVNKKGMDALSISASRASSAALIPLLLSHPEYPATVSHRDGKGNTPLHHASAAGSLKALRLLLEAGADPSAKNTDHWTPIAYSQTVQAEVYFKQLIAEFGGGRQGSTAGSVAPILPPVSGLERLSSRDSATQSTSSLSKTVTNDADLILTATTSGGGGGGGTFIGRERGDSRESNASRGEAMSRTEMLKRKGGGVRLVTEDSERPSTAGETAREWSPVATRRAGTPTTGRPQWSGYEGGRMRASSGE